MKALTVHEHVNRNTLLVWVSRLANICLNQNKTGTSPSLVPRLSESLVKLAMRACVCVISWDFMGISMCRRYVRVRVTSRITELTWLKEKTLRWRVVYLCPCDAETMCSVWRLLLLFPVLFDCAVSWLVITFTILMNIYEQVRNNTVGSRLSE